MNNNTHRQQESDARETGSPFAAIQTNPMVVLDQQNNWGRTETIVEDKTDQLVRVQLNVMAYIVVTVRAIEFDNGTNPTQLYPMASVRWGNGNADATDILDCTGGASETVAASVVDVTVFLADADGAAPVAGSGAYAKFAAQACVGITPYPQLNVSFIRSVAATPTALITGTGGAAVQGKLTKLYGFADNTGGATVYLLVFDSNVPPSNGDPTPGPLLEVIPIPTGLQNISEDYANFLPFINGISYGFSNNPTSFNDVGVTVSPARVTAVQTRN